MRNTMRDLTVDELDVVSGGLLEGFAIPTNLLSEGRA
jgi:hypothetical protein